MKISTKDYSSQYDQIWKVESGKWKVHIPPGFPFVGGPVDIIEV